MRVFYFFLLLTILIFSANLIASQRIDYFKSISTEITENHNIDKVYNDPNNEKLIYYISYDRLYKTEDGISTVLIDLTKITNNENDDNQDEFENAKKELYKTIYQEEKENIEDEYDLDDAEEYYENEIITRAERRFDDELSLLKDKFKYKGSEKYSNKKQIIPIKSLTFLQNKSTHLILETSDLFFISINSGQDFFTQDKNSISSLKISDVSSNKDEILFTSNNKIYSFNVKYLLLSELDISEYGENLISTNSFYPYITLMTEKNIFILKQEGKNLKNVKNIKFIPKSNQEYKLYCFNEKKLFITTKHSLAVYDISSDKVDLNNFNYQTINDIFLKNTDLYIGTNSGLFSYNINNKKLENISLGLVPEQVYSLSLSKNKNIFVTNHNSIYELKSFKNISELSGDKNLFAIMKKIQSTYPPLKEIIKKSYKYNSISHKKISSIYTRNRASAFMPILKVKYVNPLQNREDSIFGEIPNSVEYSSSPYVEAFLYFDLSDWVFNAKETSVNSLNSEVNELREKLV